MSILRAGQVYKQKSGKLHEVLIIDSLGLPVIMDLSKDKFPVTIGDPANLGILVNDPVFGVMDNYRLLENDEPRELERLPAGSQFFDISVQTWFDIEGISPRESAVIRIPIDSAPMPYKRIDIMIDLETMGTRHSSKICTMAAIGFDIETGKIIKENYYRINWKNQRRSTDEETVVFWNGQSDEAKQELEHTDRMDLSEALVLLSEFINEKDHVWSNGATFDISILKDAYEQYKRQLPWKFFNENDCRTIERRAFPVVTRKQFKRYGPAHHALYDARYQIQYISSMWQATKPKK